MIDNILKYDDTIMFNIYYIENKSFFWKYEFF
jgi:hypothetical protein